MAYQLPDSGADSYLKLRLSGVADAASRARWTLAAITVVCAIQLILVWNYNLSWMRAFSDAQKAGAGPASLLCVLEPAAIATPGAAGDPSAGRVPVPAQAVTACVPALPGGNRIERMLSERLLMQWVDSLSFEFPIIGAQGSTSDLGVIGGIVLLILVTWKLFALRRENHLIHDLLIETDRKLTRCRTYVFFGLVNQQLFATVGTDEPRDDLDRAEDEDLSERAIVKIRRERKDMREFLRKPWLKRLQLRLKRDVPRMENQTGRARLRFALPRSIVNCIFMLPILTLLIVLVADLLSLLHPSAFRNNEVALIFLLDPWEYVPRLIASLVLLILVRRVTYRAYDYQEATARILQDAFDDGWDILKSARSKARKSKRNGLPAPPAAPSETVAASA